MDYVIENLKEKEHHAGVKAPDDVVQICKNMGMSVMTTPANKQKELPKLLFKLWLFWTCLWLFVKIGIKVKKNERVLWQHPVYGVRYAKLYISIIQKLKGVKFIALIHDLETLRKGIGITTETDRVRHAIADNALLKVFDFVISHNQKMTDYLLSIGFQKEKVINLELFDYLYDKPVERQQQLNDYSVVIAGNLEKKKSSYVYDLKKTAANLKLYGINFEGDASDPSYKGAFHPDELIAHLNGAFGLVWDGDSLDECTGRTGHYLKYNNPHKISLYLAAKLPVIIWKKAALSDFVLEHQIGVVVENLYELNAVLSQITPEAYDNMCQNVDKMSEKVRTGGFLKAALEKCYENG